MNNNNNEWCIQGCDELADYFKKLPKSENPDCWIGNSTNNFYSKYPNNRWYSNSSPYGRKVITLEEYKDMQKDNWYIRGCKDLGDYFSDKKVSNLCGDEEKCSYFKNDDGVWDYVYDPHNNMSISRKEITLKQYLDMNREFVLPEKWAIKITEENKPIIQKYNVFNYGIGYDYTLGAYYNSSKNGNWALGDFTEITFEQFNKYVLNNKENQMKTQTLTRAQLINLHKQDSCSDWKKEIESILSTAPLATDDDHIVIPQGSIDKLIERGSDAQKFLVKTAGIVLEEDKSVTIQGTGDYKTKEVVDLLRIRSNHEYENKAFFLNSYFNWEIKRDSDGVLCLIPTKK